MMSLLRSEGKKANSEEESVTHEDMVESCCRVQTGPYEKTPTGKLHKTSNALLLLSTHQIAIACHTELLSEEIQARVLLCGQKFSGVRNIFAQGYQDRAGLGPSRRDASRRDCIEIDGACVQPHKRPMARSISTPQSS
jgi:hypothetical protein